MLVGEYSRQLWGSAGRAHAVRGAQWRRDHGLQRRQVTHTAKSNTRIFRSRSPESNTKVLHSRSRVLSWSTVRYTAQSNTRAPLRIVPEMWVRGIDFGLFAVPASPRSYRCLRPPARSIFEDKVVVSRAMFAAPVTSRGWHVVTSRSIWSLKRRKPRSFAMVSGVACGVGRLGEGCAVK